MKENSIEEENIIVKLKNKKMQLKEILHIIDEKILKEYTIVIIKSQKKEYVWVKFEGWITTANPPFDKIVKVENIFGFMDRLVIYIKE